jgi:hypothetical protein
MRDGDHTSTSRHIVPDHQPNGNDNINEHNEQR